MGGMVEAIEEGYPQREIAEASYRFQQAVESRDKVIVGVNDYVQAGEPPLPDSVHRREHRGQTARPAGRAEADARQRRRAAVRSSRCARRPAGTGNTMYPLLDCVRAYATVGEMCDALRDVWGEYDEVPLI